MRIHFWVDNRVLDADFFFAPDRRSRYSWEIADSLIRSIVYFFPRIIEADIYLLYIPYSPLEGEIKI